mgnify:CR=1 FL=1
MTPSIPECVGVDADQTQRQVADRGPIGRGYTLIGRRIRKRTAGAGTVDEGTVKNHLATTMSKIRAPEPNPTFAVTSLARPLRVRVAHAPDYALTHRPQPASEGVSKLPALTCCLQTGTLRYGRFH